MGNVMFGGKVVCICGDYMQTLPITKYASDGEVIQL
jgi:hypothetical protein